MSKSSYKSRKRRRSEDRLAELEEKVARITDFLSKRKVKAPCGSTRSSFKSSILANQNDRASDSEYLSEDSPSKKGFKASTSTNGGTTRVSNEDGNSSGEAFPSPPSSNVQTAASDKDLLKELFESEPESAKTIAWNDVVSQKWRDIVRGGLPEDQRIILIKKYMSPNEMDFLKAPRRNPECRDLKNELVVKREEITCANQDQAGVALYAFGEAISVFLRPEIQISLSPEARLAVAKVNDGAKILADHFYRLTLFRREQIMSISSSMARATADAIPADNFLFGASYGKELSKRAALMKKLSEDILKSTETMSKKANSLRMAQNFPGYHEVIRQAFILRGIPEIVLDVTVASVTEATMAKYEEPLRLWWNFCESNQTDYFQPPVVSVLKFLTTSLSNGDSYSTLDSYRSAISLISVNEVVWEIEIIRFMDRVELLKSRPFTKKRPW